MLENDVLARQLRQVTSRAEHEFLAICPGCEIQQASCKERKLLTANPNQKELHGWVGLIDGWMDVRTTKTVPLSGETTIISVLEKGAIEKSIEVLSFECLSLTGRSYSSVNYIHSVVSPVMMVMGSAAL